jgi:hypothetical protein
MLDGERLYPIPRAFEIETGVRISPATAHRLRLRKGLETVKLGGRRMTSVEAVRRHIEANTRAADGGRAASPTGPSASARAVEARRDAAERDCIKAGA